MSSKESGRYATDDARTGTTCDCTGALESRTIHSTGVCAPSTTLNIRPCVNALE